MSDVRDTSVISKDPINALFGGHLEGIVCLCSESERPLQGLAGLLDWYFGGTLSKFVRSGFVKGVAGECVYVPAEKGGKVYHLIVAGTGPAVKAGRRGAVPDSTLAAVAKNLQSLKLKNIGVSREDFGVVTKDYFTEKLKGIPLWVVQ